MRLKWTVLAAAGLGVLLTAESGTLANQRNGQSQRPKRRDPNPPQPPGKQRPKPPKRRPIDPPKSQRRPTSQPSKRPTFQPKRPAAQPPKRPTFQPKRPTPKRPTSKPDRPTFQPKRPTVQPPKRPTFQPKRPTSNETPKRPSSRPKFQPKRPVVKPPTLPGGKKPTFPGIRPPRKPGGGKPKSKTPQRPGFKRPARPGGGKTPPKTGKRPTFPGIKRPRFPGIRVPKVPVTGKSKRPGSRPGIVGGRRPRSPRNSQQRIEEMRRRSRELQRQLFVTRNRRQAATLRRTRDWQQWQRDNYRRYSWVRGRWGGSWTSRWDRYWERRWRRRYPAVLIVGATLWGMNRVGYQFGYQDYYNPYAGDPIVVGGTTIDYSQPLCQPIADGEEGGPQDQEPRMFVLARQAFMQGNYPVALSDVNAALKDAPQDTTMHEFRALVLFAMGEYKQAAAPLNAVVAVGPGLDWTSLRALYPDAATYTRQYRALEKYVTDNPKDAAAHFVLGYHYVTLGHNSHALTEFRQAADLAPKDAVARQMVAMLSKGEPKDDPAEADQEKPIETAAGAKTTISLEQFTGTWTAKRDKESFTLVMTQDDHFTWTHVAADGKKTEIKGVYAIKDGALALEPDTGGVMLANVSFKGDRDMNFRMVTDDDKDPGLSFSKS